MLGDATQALERAVGPRPSAESWLDGSADALQVREVLIVETTAADQFPDPFDRIELRTVRGQKMQPEVLGHLGPPGFVQDSVVIASVVTDDHRFAAGAASETLEFLQEVPASLRIEPAFRARHDQFAVPQAHRAKEADAFARGCVAADRVVHLGRHPETTARTVLLEVHFIHGPEIDLDVSRQLPEFFYAPLVLGDLLVPLQDEVCAVESRVAETVSGTGAPSTSRAVPFPETQTTSGHPTSESPGQTRWDWRVTPTPLSQAAFHSDGLVGQVARLRTIPPALALQIAAPSSPRCAASRPVSQPPVDRSSPAQRVALHATDGRNAKHRFAVSHPAAPLSCSLDRKSSVVSSPLIVETPPHIGNYL